MRNHAGHSMGGTGQHPVEASSSLATCILGLIAQLVERQPEELRVGGSIPSQTTIPGDHGEKANAADCGSVSTSSSLVVLPTIAR